MPFPPLSYTDDRVGSTFLRARPCRTGPGYVAWAAATLDLGDSPWDVPANALVTVRYGATANEALAALMRYTAGGD